MLVMLPELFWSMTRFNVVWVELLGICRHTNPMVFSKPLAEGLPIGTVLTTERISAALTFGDRGRTSDMQKMELLMGYLK
ncbi:hypothetical protein ZOSMA_97G00030 [Zostera marina]|uniref:Uncharacterized protein n=1 Tax=Zostera marina TaxID=29655 RepID=A0A0K9NHL2_ZOSMR|nr:hypothetical protein ZOSMA_97G00030 [Zostera marina]